MLPSPKQKRDELVALFAVGASEENYVVFVIDGYDQSCCASYGWCSNEFERGLKTVQRTIHQTRRNLERSHNLMISSARNHRNARLCHAQRFG